MNISSYKGAPRLDATNIAGITTLMNPQHIKNGIDLQCVENTIMNKDKTVKLVTEDFDPVKYYSNEINKLAEELGVELGVVDEENTYVERNQSNTKNTSSSSNFKQISKITDINLEDKNNSDSSKSSKASKTSKTSKTSKSSKSSKTSKTSKSSKSSKEPLIDKSSKSKVTFKHRSESGSGSESGSESGSGKSKSTDSDPDSDPDPDSNNYSDSDNRHKSRDGRSERSIKSGRSERSERSAKSIVSLSHKYTDVDKFISSLDKKIGIDLSDKKYKNRYSMPEMPKHKRRNENIVEHVVEKMHKESRTTHGAERERVQDVKLSKMEQISQLRMTLEEEGINCSNINHPSLDNSLEEIEAILNILRLKNDRNRYSTLAEEIMLGFAEGIETVFDGTRSIPILKWKPDYRGYHSTINIKLHRMRFETSQVVGSIIEKHNINSTMRIIFELLPSFFLYPRQQTKQRNSPGLHSDPVVSDASMAYASIRDMEDKKNMDNLENI
jgi:hypothetical protein